MNKKLWLIAFGAIVAFILIVAKSNVDNNNKPVDYGKFRGSAIRKLIKTTSDYASLNPHSIIEPAPFTGSIPEKIIGDIKTATIILYEYADYACGHCASWNKIAKELVDNSNGKLVIVYRGFLLNFNSSLIVASAAQIQGYWQEYKDLIFANQNSWSYIETAPELQKELTSYFNQASKNKGDIARFETDMKSESVAKRIAFEYKMGEKASIEGTPTFFFNGNKIELKNLRDFINNKLKEI